nr:MAG TPA: hypothetical protein [Caudoviricetes sp.]
MKALIRNAGETVTEDMHIPGIDWDTGMPLTNSVWAGGPYKLIDDYDPQTGEKNIVQSEHPKTEEEIVEDDYVIIEGKKYSKVELRSLLE